MRSALFPKDSLRAPVRNDRFESASLSPTGYLLATVGIKARRGRPPFRSSRYCCPGISARRGWASPNLVGTRLDAMTSQGSRLAYPDL